VLPQAIIGSTALDSRFEYVMFLMEAFGSTS